MRFLRLYLPNNLSFNFVLAVYQVDATKKLLAHIKVCKYNDLNRIEK